MGRHQGNVLQTPDVDMAQTPPRMIVRDGEGQMNVVQRDSLQSSFMPWKLTGEEVGVSLEEVLKDTSAGARPAAAVLSELDANARLLPPQSLDDPSQKLPQMGRRAGDGDGAGAPG